MSALATPACLATRAYARRAPARASRPAAAVAPLASVPTPTSVVGTRSSRASFLGPARPAAAILDARARRRDSRASFLHDRAARRRGRGDRDAEPRWARVLGVGRRRERRRDRARDALLLRHLHPRAASVRDHARHVPVRVSDGQVQALRVIVRERRVGVRQHVPVLQGGGDWPRESSERGDPRGVRRQPRELPGHLLPVPPAASVQVHLQGEQLHHSHHRVVDVHDRAHRPQAHGRAR